MLCCIWIQMHCFYLARTRAGQLSVCCLKEHMAKCLWNINQRQMSEKETRSAKTLHCSLHNSYKLFLFSTHTLSLSLSQPVHSNYHWRSLSLLHSSRYGHCNRSHLVRRNSAFPLISVPMPLSFSFSLSSLSFSTSAMSYSVWAPSCVSVCVNKKLLFYFCDEWQALLQTKAWDQAQNNKSLLLLNLNIHRIRF